MLKILLCTQFDVWILAPKMTMHERPLYGNTHTNFSKQNKHFKETFLAGCLTFNKEITIITMSENEENEYPPDWNSSSGDSILHAELLYWPILGKDLPLNLIKGLSKNSILTFISGDTMMKLSCLTFITGSQRLVIMKIHGEIPNVRFIVNTYDSYVRNKRVVVINLQQPIKPTLVNKYDLYPYLEGIDNFTAFGRKHTNSVKNAINFAENLLLFYLSKDSSTDNFIFHKEPENARENALASKNARIQKCSICDHTFSTYPNFLKHLRNMHSNSFINEVQRLKLEIEDKEREKSKIESQVHDGILSKKCGARKLSAIKLRLEKLTLDYERKKSSTTKYEKKMRKMESAVGIDQHVLEETVPSPSCSAATSTTTISRKPRRKITNKRPHEYTDDDYYFLYGLRPLKVCIQRIPTTAASKNSELFQDGLDFGPFEDNGDIRIYTDNAEDNIIESNVRRASLDKSDNNLIYGDDDGQLFIDLNKSPEKGTPYIAFFGQKSSVDDFAVRNLLSRPFLPENVKKADEEKIEGKLLREEVIRPILDVCIRQTYVKSIERDLFWQAGLPGGNADWYVEKKATEYDVPSPFLHFPENHLI